MLSMISCSQENFGNDFRTTLKVESYFVMGHKIARFPRFHDRAHCAGFHKYRPKPRVLLGRQDRIRINVQTLDSTFSILNPF